MCQDDDIPDTNLGKKIIFLTKKKKLFHNFYLDKFRNGVETTTQQYTQGSDNDQTRKTGDVKATRRLHESWNNYDRCFNRNRNGGKFNTYSQND